MIVQKQQYHWHKEQQNRKLSGLLKVERFIERDLIRLAGMKSSAIYEVGLQQYGHLTIQTYCNTHFLIKSKKI